MHAAEQTEDPLVLASAARAGTHAFLANGRFDDAMDLGATAAGWLKEQMDDADPAALSLFGMLQLRTATAASRRQERSATTDLLRVAAALNAGARTTDICAPGEKLRTASFSTPSAVMSLMTFCSSS